MTFSTRYLRVSAEGEGGCDGRRHVQVGAEKDTSCSDCSIWGILLTHLGIPSVDIICSASGRVGHCVALIVVRSKTSSLA